LEVRAGAGRGLAVDELGLASLAAGAEAAFAAPQADGDDVAVVVAMLDGGVLGHVHDPHRRLASAAAPGLSIERRPRGSAPLHRPGPAATMPPSRPRTVPPTNAAHPPCSMPPTPSTGFPGVGRR